jgi:GAF domain-containing protein
VSNPDDSELSALRARIRVLERENARLMVQLVEQRQLAEAGRVATIAVLEGLELQDVLHTLLDALAALVPFDAACVMMLDGHGNAVVQAGVGYSPPVLPGELVFDLSEQSHLDELVSSMRSVAVPDTALHSGWRHGVEVSAATRSWLGVPLIARGQVLGLYAIDKLEPNFFTPAHVQLAENLAVHAALAIANALVYAELKA